MSRLSSFVSRRWKLLLNVITIGALALFAVALHRDLWDTVRRLGDVNAWLLLLLIPIEALNYHAQTRQYQRMFAIVGNKLSYRLLYRASLELTFVNHVFPSGGAAGISYIGLRLKGGDITAAKATLIHIMKLALQFLSFELILLFGMFCLAIMGRVNGLTILVGTAISVLLVVGTAVFVYVVGDQARINAFFTTVTRGLNKLIQVVRPGHPETIKIDAAREVFNDFHANYNELKRDLPRLKAPFWDSFLANATEVAAVYSVFLAFGRPVNIGAVILAYGVANFAGLVSVLPGGVGIYEFLMTAVLATAGIPAGVSLPIVVMYRVVNTLIQVPLGYVLYQKYLSAGGKAVQ